MRKPPNVKLGGRDARDHRQRRIAPQRLLHDHRQGLEPVELLEGRATARRARGSPRARAPARPGARELVGHRRERARGGVVGRHHQEDHVIDDLLVGEAVAFLGLGAAQARRTCRGSRPARRFGSRSRKKPISHSRPARPRWNSRPGIGSRMRDIDAATIASKARFMAAVPTPRSTPTKIDDGHVEGQLLVGGERRAASRSPLAPRLEVRLDHRVHARGVGAQRGPREGRVHDLAVVLVVVAVPQQQAVREDAAHDHVPGLLGGEDAVRGRAARSGWRRVRRGSPCGRRRPSASPRRRAARGAGAAGSACRRGRRRRSRSSGAFAAAPAAGSRKRAAPGLRSPCRPFDPPRRRTPALPYTRPSFIVGRPAAAERERP